MSKQIIVGDIHGHDSWLDVLKNENQEFDKFIFIGDYVDSFSRTGVEQARNLDDILDFKSRHKDKVVLLIGNHDYQYMNNGLMGERYSGFQPAMYQTFRNIFDTNEKLFQMCYEDTYGTVYTHAGLTKTFVEKKIGSYSMMNVNDVFHYRPSAFRFSPVDHSGCGDSVESSCIWVRPDSLYNDQIDRLQVVGHTTVNQINHPAKSERRGFYLIDCLHNRQYLVRTNENFEIKTYGRA